MVSALAPRFGTKWSKYFHWRSPCPLYHVGVLCPWAYRHVTCGTSQPGGGFSVHSGGKSDRPVELLELDSGPQTGGTSWILSPVLPSQLLLKIDL